MQSFQYYVKAIYAGLVAGLGSVATALAGTDATFGNISDGQWVAAAVLFLVGFGGILGWQSRPASVSTSIKE
jgi:hypothetical protein